jgi:hypothetical protein
MASDIDLLQGLIALLAIVILPFLGIAIAAGFLHVWSCVLDAWATRQH